MLAIEGYSRGERGVREGLVLLTRNAARAEETDHGRALGVSSSLAKSASCIHCVLCIDCKLRLLQKCIE